MEEKVFELLNNLNIKYDLVSHEAVFTVIEANEIVHNIDGIGCKNLFLIDDNKNYYIYVLPDTNMADFNLLASILEKKKIKFASEDKLFEKTNLTRGSVTPLGIINNSDRDITILIDKSLINEKILMHPNINTMTISLLFDDLIKVLEFSNSKYMIV